MAVEREYVGIEPLFAVGAYIAASANIDFQQIFRLAAFAQMTVVIMFICLFFQQVAFSKKTYRFIILATALGAGIFCGLNSRLMELQNPERNNLVISFLDNLRLRLESTIDCIQFQDNRTNSIIKALLTGNKKDIPIELIEAFRKSGASHILALSGLHLGIIYGLVSCITGLLGHTSMATATRCFLNLFICSAYTLATGASSSITRALCFIILKEIGTITDRPSKLERIFRKSLMIQLIINPASILEVGFQLSYAAMAGITWIHPLLQKIWPEESNIPIAKKIWDTASVSISCQLTTSPLAYYYFESFPKYFLLTNLIALPLTGIIIPVSVATTALSAIGICPDIMIELAEKVTGCLIFALKTISQM